MSKTYLGENSALKIVTSCRNLERLSLKVCLGGITQIKLFKEIGQLKTLRELSFDIDVVFIATNLYSLLELANLC